MKKAEDELKRIWGLCFGDNFKKEFLTQEYKRFQRKLKLGAYKHSKEQILLFWKLKIRIDDYKKQIVNQDALINQLREENKCIIGLDKFIANLRKGWHDGLTGSMRVPELIQILKQLREGDKNK